MKFVPLKTVAEGHDSKLEVDKVLCSKQLSSKSKIVKILGIFDNSSYKLLEYVTSRLSNNGHLVIFPACYCNKQSKEYHNDIIDSIIKFEISKSDIILVIDSDSIFSKNMLKNIEYAAKLGKEICYLSDNPDIIKDKSDNNIDKCEFANTSTSDYTLCDAEYKIQNNKGDK